MPKLVEKALTDTAIRSLKATSTRVDHFDARAVDRLQKSGLLSRNAAGDLELHALEEGRAV
jgi:hypothetical protein